MNRGTHAADALGDRPGIAWIPAQQDKLNPTPHLPGGPGLVDPAVVDIDINPQVTLYTGDRVDRYALGHGSDSLLVLVGQLRVFPRQHRETTGDDDVTEYFGGEDSNGDQ